MKNGLSYMGGKKRLAPKIVPYLPPHQIYVEPFCGGLAVLFAKGVPPQKRGYSEVANDKDDRLITFYREIKSNPGLIDRIRATLYSRSERYRSHAILKDPSSFSSEDIAWAFFVATYQGFAKITDINYWGITLHTDKASSGTPSFWNNTKESLEIFAQRIETVSIECDDAIKIIRRWDSPNTLFYIDPPYHGSCQKYWETFSKEEYQELMKVIDTIEGSFVLSGYDSGMENKEWKRVDFSTVCALSGKGRTRIDPLKEGESANRKRIDSIWIKEGTLDYSNKFLWSPSQGYLVNSKQMNLW